MSPAAQRSARPVQVEVETPEQVVLSYTIAGIASSGRGCARSDYAILSVMMKVRAGALHPEPFASQLRCARWRGRLRSSRLLRSAFITGGYYVILEGMWDGQTPGKRRFGLRVVRDGGYSITFGASAVRNLVRFVDMQPGVVVGAYSVGILSAVLSRIRQTEFGDYTAGTIVVRERGGHDRIRRMRRRLRRRDRCGGQARSQMRHRQAHSQAAPRARPRPP